IPRAFFFYLRFFPDIQRSSRFPTNHKITTETANIASLSG
ncbi:lipoyltransferase and lipoate-protein ligase family protein, partial [Listeria monocytogenes FSL F2-208]